MLATMGEGGPTLLQGIQDLFQGFQTWKRLLVLQNPRNTERLGTYPVHQF
jgi:hypothetical protein